MYIRKYLFFTLLLSTTVFLNVQAQDLTMFFPASQLEETQDDYGNTYFTGPADAVIPLPEHFSQTEQPELTGVFIDPAAIFSMETDAEGNSYITTALDDSLTPEMVYTSANSNSDNLWRLRSDGIPDMMVLEAYGPNGTEDAPTLKTTVTMAKGGTYEVFLLFGDIGSIGTDDEVDVTPIQAGFEGENLQTYTQADGHLIADYAFNILEVSLGNVTLEDNSSFSVIVDDVVGGGRRTAYSGLRITQDGPILPPDPPTYDFHQDNLWSIYPVTGRTILISYGPGSQEDSPPLTTRITLAHAGTYEVIFNFLDSDDNPDEGIIEASLNDGETLEYGAAIATRASGGTSPGYPWIDNTYVSGMFWYSAVMGQVTVEAGETIEIHVDDAQDWSGLEYITSSYEGVTLRVIEGGPSLTEIQVSPAAMYEWIEDNAGNRYTIVAADESLTKEQVFTTTASETDNLWRVRDLGIYGTIYESRSGEGTEDAPQLKTIVEVANAGTYDVFLLFGDVGEVGTDDETSVQPILAGFEGEPLKTYYQRDAEFIGLWGYNIMEVKIGTVTVDAGGQIVVYIDDSPVVAEELLQYDIRTNYAGLRIDIAETSVANWNLF
ncbi:MAG: hypothetical protein ACOX5R_21425 [bacterium]